MQFEILSHAGLKVEHDGKTLLVDPWLRGSSYWRSWWNYPPVDPLRISQLRADYVYLSHIHWDHFHGPSLRALGKDIQLLVPQDRYTRMRDDLRSMGFKHVVEMAHGVAHRLTPGFTITPFLFFPMTDSMLAVRAGDTVLLDANDCKMCGIPLKQVKRQFPSIDFVLRSHSSANTRVCHEYLDQPRNSFDRVDNKEDYLRSFSNFMSAVQPRYAVPFASNHCHLHRDTLQFNRFQQTPKDVEQYFRNYKTRNPIRTELVTMLPGSIWDERTGFKLAPEQEWFLNRDERIAAYAQSEAAALSDYYARESKACVSDADMRRYFERLFKNVPWFWRRRLAGRSVYFKATSEARVDIWKIDLHARRLEAASNEEYAASDMRIEMPAIILKQALKMNMFAHAGISKRTRWLATRDAMDLLGFFMFMLDLQEYELIPLHRNLSWRSIRVWIRRWREVLGYAQLIWLMKRRRISGKEVEQVALLEYS
jgi:UDP-MurNAc hydroxylase